MECRDRYLMIAADLSFTGEEPCFEAVDGTGVYPITKLYAAECGYSISVLPLPGHVELRASYFSCHTDNKDDKVFTFNFNLITHDEGKEVTYALNKTCSPSLPWSPREVTCEVNYMEVSVKSDMTCPSATKMDDWNTALTTAYATASSDWQVIFQKAGQQLTPMSLSEARKQNYVFDVTDGRLVFRTPYGQPDSFTTTVDDVPVEVVHPTLFSRQSWIVLMVDLVAACSMHEGSYDGSHLVWETPEVLHPLAYGLSGLESSQVNMGVSGGLLEQPIVEEKGYIMEKHGAIVQIGIPYNAEGGYRKSFVMDNLYYEFYIFHLYLEQMFADEDHVDTRLRLFRPLATPMLSRPAFTSNRTVLEERMFTVYLGDVPEDVDLVSLQLNGQDFAVPLINASSLAISKVLQPNYTHGYTLRVPFDNAVVLTQLSKDGVLQHALDINYTLAILPENEAYYHLASVVALITDVFPPSFEAVCSEKGISFKRDHQPYDYLWQVYIGPDPLTSELAAEQGYIMHNDSQSLLLDVPLFTDGYTYKDIGLKTFFGTFSILVRDPKTLEVQGSSVKTCPFTTAELIVCSTDGKMAVVVDVSMAIPSGGIPARTSLRDKHCGPKEADNTRVRFSFALNSCGTRVKLGRDYVTYENDIIFNQKHLTVKKPLVARDATDKVTVKCTYPLAGLHRLFSVHRFESDMPGVGRIMHEKIPMEGIQQKPQVPTINQKLQFPTIRPTTGLQTVSVSTTRRPNKLPAYHPPAQYIKVFSFLKDFTNNLSKKVPPIIPSEFFYTDPTMGRGRRIPNIVSDLRVFECFHLNTPPPIMSACPAPPNRPDPFRSGPHPTRELGSPTWRMQPVLPPSRVVLQLTQEEDQAVTNLLKLHHHQPIQRHGDEAFVAPQNDPSGGVESLPDDMDMDLSPSLSHPAPMDPALTEETDELFHSDVQYPWAAMLGSQLHQGRLWSDVELEAANTLLTHLSLLEEDGLWSWNQHGPAVTLPDHLPYALQEGSSVSTGDVHPLASSLPASSLPPSSLSSDSEVESGPSVFGDLLGARDGTLSESEGAAVHALLSLGDM
ncbi:zona pellucida protein AX 4 [Centroberyx affinis]|uniref:zona pellucida protein AX 4 n=1 Tax=Centroberyx affinis TaxID=166261 RepID=UPI003A5B9718